VGRRGRAGRGAPSDEIGWNNLHSAPERHSI